MVLSTVPFLLLLLKCRLLVPLLQLGQGILVKVSPSLIKRCKNHFHNLTCGATVILGNNGYIWVCPPKSNEQDEGGFVQNLQVRILIHAFQRQKKLVDYKMK